MKRLYSTLFIIPGFYFLLLLVFGQSLSSCRKNNAELPYLQFKESSVSILPAVGEVAELVVESNLMWRASVLPANTDWLQLEGVTGLGKDTIRIKVIKENQGTAPRTATIVVESIGGRINLQSQATVTQQAFNPQFVWRKTMGGISNEEFMGICATSDGGHLAVGYTNSNNTGWVRPGHSADDVWAVRVDKNGDSLWTRVLGGSRDERANAVVATPNNEFIIVGMTSSSDGDVWNDFGSDDLWLVKLKSNGDTAWTRSFGGAYYDNGRAVSIAPDGSILVGGISADASGNHNAFVLKVSSQGELLWQYSYGGTQYEVANAIVATPDGGAIVAGETMSPELPGMHGRNDGYIFRLTANGSMTWAKLLGGSLADELNAIAITPEGDCVATGYTFSNNGDIAVNRGISDAWVVKLKGNGDLLWSTTIGGLRIEEAKAIKIMPGGDYLITGLSDSHESYDIGPNKGFNDVLIARISSSGRKVWTKLIGGSNYDAGFAITTNSDNTFTIAGMVSSTDNDINTTYYGGDSDSWVVRMQEF